MAYEVNVDNFDRSDWERYAKEFADYSIYQTWPYQQICGEMNGQQVSRVIVRDDDGHAVMMCQIRIKHVKALGLRIGYVQWGPLVRGVNGTFKCCVESLKALRVAYVGTKVNVLRVVPNVCNDETGKKLSQMLISSGFQYVPSFACYRTLILRVDDNEEEIRKRLRKSFRRDLRYAEKAGIQIRQGHNDEFCKILEELYLASLKRKGFKGLDVQEFIRPQQMLSSAEKMNIIIAYCDGEPVSTHLANNLGDTALVLLAASNEKGLACGASYLIWYRGAVSAFNAGMRWYDLGGIDPDNNPNVYQFKSRMGGDEVLHIGAFEACSSGIVKAVWHIGNKVYQRIKNL